MDNQLMHRITKKDHEALMELYSRYGGLVKGLAFRVLQDDQLAEEVTQDVFLKVWRQPDRWNPAFGRLSTWLMAVTRNAAIDRLRSEQRHLHMISTDSDPETATSAQGSTLDDPLWHDGQLVRQLLDELPDHERQVIILSFYRGLTHSELATHLRLPLGTVKTRIRRGLKRLRGLWRAAQ